MKILEIEGCRPLQGEVWVSGSKNAALPIMFATILTGAECVLHGVPDILDVRNAAEILRLLGATVEMRGNDCVINTRCVVPSENQIVATERLRGSLYLLGAMLGRFKETYLPQIGGCDFGGRPIDYHLSALCALGATLCRDREDACFLRASDLRGGDIFLPRPSVGATINTLLTAVTAKGRTRIIGAAREPHVVDTARFLQACGARIYGAGEQCICIDGVASLHGATYTVVSDMIEAGTFLAAGAACGGEISVSNVSAAELAEPLRILEAMGNELRYEEGRITLKRKRSLRGVSFYTAPYPGFPTDLQPQFGVLLALSKGGGRITEAVFEKRFQYVKQLNRMGCHASLHGNSVCFCGKDRLRGAAVEVGDLRAGAALSVAALAAEGRSRILNASVIDRGYECFAEKIQQIGGRIRYAEEKD